MTGPIQPELDDLDQRDGRAQRTQTDAQDGPGPDRRLRRPTRIALNDVTARPNATSTAANMTRSITWYRPRLAPRTPLPKQHKTPFGMPTSNGIKGLIRARSIND